MVQPGLRPRVTADGPTRLRPRGSDRHGAAEARGQARGADPAGALHAGIANLATDLGVPARAEPIATGELLDRLDDAPLIVSVTEQFPDDGRTGGHLVIARGYESGSDPKILIRDPSAWGQTHDRVPLSRFAPSYADRAITFTPWFATERPGD